MNKNHKELEPIKQDENGGEVVWKLERRINLWAFYGYIVYFSLLCGLLYILFICYTKVEGLVELIAFLCFAYSLYCMIMPFYHSLNLKTMYIKKDNLFIKKYLGKDIILSLGNFIVFDIWVPLNFTGVKFYYIQLISKHSLFFLYSFIESNNTNIDEIRYLLKPYIIDYLIKCDEKAYNKFKIFYAGAETKSQYDIDYNEIDKLRKEKQSNE